MSLNLPVGSRCFVDSNILVYHFTQDPLFSSICTPFMRRIFSGEVTAFTSALALADALHKIMLAEVLGQFKQPKPLAYIQRRPELISMLKRYHAACNDIYLLNLQLLPVDFSIFREASSIAANLNLLTNDACIVALMRSGSLEHLATNDDDFDDIAGITTWKPR